MRLSFLLAATLGLALLADTKMPFSALPAAVRAAAKAESHGAEILGASTEVEKGQETYEVATRLEGKSRDLTFDSSGKLLAVEQEVSWESLPAAVKEALQKRVAGRKIKMVESVTQGSSTSYEATLITKAGHSNEIALNAEGTPHHE